MKNGAQGLKIFKNFGMDMKYKSGERVKVDDPNFDPIWEMCGKLGIPVLIHTAEPSAFFDPIDKYNERWLELKQFPNRARPPEKYPTFETLMTERNHMLAKHPNERPQSSLEVATDLQQFISPFEGRVDFNLPTVSAGKSSNSGSFTSEETSPWVQLTDEIAESSSTRSGATEDTPFQVPGITRRRYATRRRGLPSYRLPVTRG